MFDTSKASLTITPDEKAKILSSQKQYSKRKASNPRRAESIRKPEAAVNINVSGVNMYPIQSEPIQIDTSLLQTDLWYTAFGMSLKQLCNPNDKILIEGELHKYKPGIDTMYIPRWCQLTQNAIRIYKTQMAAKGFSAKPILALPLRIFKCVKKSKFVVPEKGKNVKLIKVLNRNQFEL